MKIPYGCILENAARLAGYNPDIDPLSQRTRLVVAFAINNCLQRIYAEHFAQLRRIEFRRYRPDWSDDVVWIDTMECWHAGSYWRLDASAGSGAVEPGMAGSGWRPLDMKEVAAFIAFSQPWERAVIDAGGVDLAAFAYPADPKYNPSAAPIKGCSMSALGISIPAPAPAGVFIVFQPRFPRIAFVDWTSGTSYPAGSVVYRPDAKDVFLALDDASGSVPPEADSATWAVLRIEDDFEEYMVRSAAAELMTTDQGKHQSRAEADHAFDRICERLQVRVNDARARAGRFR
jgi:hypothetical protein